MKILKKTITLLLVMNFIICPVSQNIAFGKVLQENKSSKVIIISTKVGEVIDRQERDKYQMFQAFPDFQSAKFLLMPDSTYAIHITYLKNKNQKTQTWNISKQEFLEKYKKPLDYFNPDSSQYSDLWKNPLIQIETVDNQKYKGSLQGLSADSVVIINTEIQTHTSKNKSPSIITVGLNEIAYLSLVRKSHSINASTWVLGPAAVGAFVGLIKSTDQDKNSIVPNFDGVIIFVAGVSIGLIGYLTNGIVDALNAVDIDIPWSEKTKFKKKSLISQIGTGQYHSPHLFRFSPYVEVISRPNDININTVGGRIQFHFKPRTGLELNFGFSNWSHKSLYKYDLYKYEKVKIKYFSSNVFIFITKKKLVNPFIVAGLGWAKSVVRKKYRGLDDKYTNKGLFANFYVGADIQITNWLCLEGRYGFLNPSLNFDDNFSFQLALKFGLSY